MDYAGVLTDGPPGVEAPLVGVLRRARGHGVRTGVLSNSATAPGGPGYWTGVADAVLASGPLGFAKPDPRAYLAVADALGLDPGECVFVDDLAVNVRGAAAVGMVGVVHHDLEVTLGELRILFDRVF